MPKEAVLLINLGSPDSTSVGDVRRYLKEFLTDERVIDVPFVRKFVRARDHPEHPSAQSQPRPTKRFGWKRVPPYL